RSLYAKYCALCHGKDREGYAADNAPSLKSEQLMATTQQPRSAYNFLHHTIAYGRTGTAMAPYARNQGGPLDWDDMELLIQWLHESSGVKKPIEMSAKPVSGDAIAGKVLYAQHCASCHGTKGEGIKAPALANPMFLATASDAFLYHTISEGRSGTPMPSFKDSLTKTQINAVTAYVRSRASGWNAPTAMTVTNPLPKDYIQHPANKSPVFTLREGLYVSAKQLNQAIKDSARMDKVMTVLDVIKDKSIYQDYSGVAQDSIIVAAVQKMETSGIFIDIAKLIKMPKFAYKVKKTYPTMNQTFIDKISNKTFGYEDVIKFDWKITTEKMKIGEYNTQKATTEYRGRKWTAWFASEIPLQDGPYRFYGLPGLIVKIEDEGKNYSWELKGNKKVPNYEEVS
ncbi:MAG: GLPGLI family protein, partial [Pedobacter sp.]